MNYFGLIVRYFLYTIKAVGVTKYTFIWKYEAYIKEGMGTSLNLKLHNPNKPCQANQKVSKRRLIAYWMQ